MITKIYNILEYNILQCYIANTNVYYKDCVANSDAEQIRNKILDRARA